MLLLHLLGRQLKTSLCRVLKTCLASARGNTLRCRSNWHTTTGEIVMRFRHLIGMLAVAFVVFSSGCCWCHRWCHRWHRHGCGDCCETNCCYSPDAPPPPLASPAP